MGYEIKNKYNVRPERICNRYLEKTYGKKFTLIDKTYISEFDGYDDHIWGYRFPLEDKEKTGHLAKILSKLYMYTLNNVKEASPQVIRCNILVLDDKVSYPISDDWTKFIDEEEIYNFVSEQIEKAWKEYYH